MCCSPPWIAAAALAVMLSGDAAAALIGRKFGRHKVVNGKSLEGSLSFLIAGYIAAAAVLLITWRPAGDYLTGIAAVFLADLAELFQKQLKIDDNFTIPLAVGAVFMAAEYFL